MDVFTCVVCGQAIDEGDRKGIAVVFRTSDPRRRPFWGPHMIMET